MSISFKVEELGDRQIAELKQNLIHSSDKPVTEETVLETYKDSEFYLYEDFMVDPNFAVYGLRKKEYFLEPYSKSNSWEVGELVDMLHTKMSHELNDSEVIERLKETGFELIEMFEGEGDYEAVNRWISVVGKWGVEYIEDIYALAKILDLRLELYKSSKHSIKNL